MEPLVRQGDVVLFSNRGVKVHALVLQSLLTSQLDETQDNGIRYDEQATIVFIKPELQALGQILSSAQMDTAMERRIGVAILKDEPENPDLKTFATPGLERHPFDFHAEQHPQLIQDSPLPTYTGLRNTLPAGKFTGNIVREDKTAEGQPADNEPVAGQEIPAV